MKIFSLLLILLFAIPQIPEVNKGNKPITANQVIELIKDNVSCNWAEETVDTYKSGDPGDNVSGIITCMFADMNVLKTAVEKNCNLIITHEPIYYNHLDETESIKDSPVFQEKMAYIKKHKLIIFRFHDHIHRTKPDGIYAGMVKQLGWEKNKTDHTYHFYKFEKQTLAEFADKLSDKLGTNDFRIIGDPDFLFTKVSFAVGAPGFGSHQKMLDSSETEVMVIGEAREWETYQYANDAVLQGKKKAIIVLGHIPSEEAGMDYCADWMSSFVKGVPITFVKNKPVYWSPN